MRFQNWLSAPIYLSCNSGTFHGHANTIAEDWTEWRKRQIGLGAPTCSNARAEWWAQVRNSRDKTDFEATLSTAAEDNLVANKGHLNWI